MDKLIESIFNKNYVSKLYEDVVSETSNNYNDLIIHKIINIIIGNESRTNNS